MVCQSQGFAFAYLLFLAREAKEKTWKKTVFFVTSSFIGFSWFSDSSFLLGCHFIRHTRYFFQNTEWKPFKTPKCTASKRWKRSVNQYFSIFAFFYKLGSRNDVSYVMRPRIPIRVRRPCISTNIFCLCHPTLRLAWECFFRNSIPWRFPGIELLGR